MPTAQQNALVQKYCAVCHTDAVRNGGLSLEHFDASVAAPSLKAILLSKLTGGVRLDMVRVASVDPSAAALVDKNMGAGAVGAAGIPKPNKAIIDAWIQAFAVGSVGATEWSVERTIDHEAKAPVLTASILREMPSAKRNGDAEVYRLIASCNTATQEGRVQLAWAPAAQSGALTASMDGRAAVRYPVEGSEKMGNGSGYILHGAAALMLAENKGGVPGTGFALPGESLTISDLFPQETVVFPFANLPKQARHELEACFPKASSSKRSAAGGSEPPPSQ